MKSKIISVFITTALSTIVLCSTISHAAEKQFIIQAVTYNTSDIASKQVMKLAQHRSNEISIYTVNSFDEILNRPLVNITSSIAGDYIPTPKFTKKNEIFELATIFNDKLQQILSKLSFNENTQNKDQFINSDKPKDKNSIQCKNSKNLR